MKIFSAFCFIIFSLGIISHAKAQKQNNDVLYVFKKDWSSAKDFNDAAYFMQVTKENDSTYICRYYNKFGPMVKQESYFDADLTIPNGRFCWYNANGDIDTIGSVDHGKKDDYWYYYRDTTLLKQEWYESGHLAERKDYEHNLYVNKDGITMTLEEKKLQDSLNAAHSETTFKILQVEAKYKNGQKDWTNYISKNLKTPDRLMNVLGRGRHQVCIAFVVDKEGNTGDVYIIHSCEWSGDNNVIQLIKDSPKWQPAMQNGRTVYYRQKQTITYEVN
jgi:hypothetical protein